MKKIYQVWLDQLARHELSKTRVKYAVGLSLIGRLRIGNAVLSDSLVKLHYFQLAFLEN